MLRIMLFSQVNDKNMDQEVLYKLFKFWLIPVLMRFHIYYFLVTWFINLLKVKSLLPISESYTPITLLIRREIAYGSPFQVEGFNSPVIALHKNIFTVLCTFHERHRIEFLIVALSSFVYNSLKWQPNASAVYTIVPRFVATSGIMSHGSSFRSWRVQWRFPMFGNVPCKCAQDFMNAISSSCGDPC